MLCEIVLLFNSPLVQSNRLEQIGASSSKPVITMQNSASADEWVSEVSDIKDQLIAALEGEALPGEDLDLKQAPLGGVAHEVGTLRLGTEDYGRRR